MQNRIHSLEDRIFIYKSLGAAPNRCIYCGSILCKLEADMKKGSHIINIASLKSSSAIFTHLL